MKPKLPMPTNCPVTGRPLEVTRLENPESGIVIEGRFAPNEFALLPEDQLEFMRLFVKVRGNLKEVERMLGVSYPTVRLRFENVLRTLGYEVAENQDGPDAEPPPGGQAGIVAALERGEITPEEATSQLQALRRRG